MLLMVIQGVVAIKNSDSYVKDSCRKHTFKSVCVCVHMHNCESVTGLTWGLTLGPQPMPGEFMEWGPMGELMTEKGEARPFMGELSVLMGE